MPNIIICGLDRLGKSTLIEGLIKEMGHRPVIHFGKPVASLAHDMSLEKFQIASFKSGFKILETVNGVIFDRFHLGECVYAKRYRGYDGSYVFDLEKQHPRVLDTAFLVLLRTDNFSFVVDDGDSFDFDAKEEEMLDFEEAFSMSKFKNKLAVNVHAGQGLQRTKESILGEVVRWIQDVQNADVYDELIRSQDC